MKLARSLSSCVAAASLAAASLGCGSSTPSGTDGGADAGGADGGVVDGAQSDGPGADVAPSPDSSAPSSTWVMGYYPSWDDPQNGGSYAVADIDWDGLTHVATAFYIPDGNGGWTAGSFDATTANQIIAAAHAHGKKAIASIGGANTGAGFEGSMQASHQATFLGNLASLVAMGYDGLDIDWEGGNLSVQQDQALETTLIQAVRSQSPNIVLTMTAGYENENLLDDLSFYGTIIGQLDQLNLMTYGMSGAYQGWQSWHSSPLHWNHVGSTPTGIDSSVTHYLAAKVPAAKLGVGSGFYGSCYTSPVTAPVQALGGSQIVGNDSVMSYRNILASYWSASAYHYDSAAEVPYLTLSGSNPEKCTYVTYEDATSLAAKGAWVKSQGLGGLIIWTISEGFVPSGATVQDKNPLLEATKTAFLQ